MPWELGDCSGLYQESAVSKAQPEKEREGGGALRNWPKGLLGWLQLRWVLCPAKTVCTMQPVPC